jgi:hypothetical protein
MSFARHDSAKTGRLSRPALEALCRSGKVAGRVRCHEEATRITPDRPNPTDSGDAADLSIPQGYLEEAPHFELLKST